MKKLPEAYILKCRLCIDVRREATLQPYEIKEFIPIEFYFHLK